MTQEDLNNKLRNDNMGFQTYRGNVAEAIEEINNNVVDLVDKRPAIRPGKDDTAVIEGDIANNIASGNYSHAEGNNTQAIGESSHAEGKLCIASGTQSHAEGSSTRATNWNTHAEGIRSEAIGEYAHAEGTDTTAEARSSHSEGENSHARGAQSHAEGNGTTASGGSSHSEGNSTKAEGEASHAEGKLTQALGYQSHAEGNSTIASKGTWNQHVQGKFNKEMDLNYAHIVGNGTSEKDRRNAHTLDWDGNAWFQGQVYIGSKEKGNKDTGSQLLLTKVEIIKLLREGDSELIAALKEALFAE